MMMLVFVILARTFHQYIEFHSAEIRAHHARRPQFVAVDRQFLEFGLQIVKIEPQVQERTDGHIPTDSGETVEVKRLHNKREMLARANISPYVIGPSGASARRTRFYNSQPMEH